MNVKHQKVVTGISQTIIHFVNNYLGLTPTYTLFAKRKTGLAAPCVFVHFCKTSHKIANLTVVVVDLLWINPPLLKHSF